MINYLLKNLSILKKFLLINFIFFTIIGLFTFMYLKNIQPNLIKKKSSNHIQIINNTIENLNILNIKSLSFKSIEYDINYYGNLNILTKIFKMNKLDVNNSTNLCVIRLK